MNSSSMGRAGPEAVPARQGRQRAEILDNIDAGRLQRAADLAHEHLAEFPTDRSARSAIVAALERCSDVHVRRRAGEFEPP